MRAGRFGALVWVVACGGDRLDVTRGDPVQNLLTVSFETRAEGEAVVRWETDGVSQERSLGHGPAGRRQTTIWAPSGATTELRAWLDRGGALVELGSRRVRVPQAPRKIRWELGRVDRERSQIGRGVLLLNAYDDRDAYAMVIDRDARVLWWVEPDEPHQRILRVRPGRDQQSIVWGRWAAAHRTDPDDGYLTRLALTAEQRRTDTRAVAHHHDWTELPDGRFAWLSWVYDDARLFQGVGVVPMAADAIRVAEEGAVEGEETVLWDFFDGYPSPPIYQCGHQNPGQFAGERWWEWSHSNSLQYDEGADALRLLPRYLDAVVEVGLDGVMNWQVGGLASDLALDGWFRHGHASALSGDQIAVFDNGDHKPEPIVSRAVGLELDFLGGAARELWSVPDPQGAFTDFLGDVAVLPGGNVLVLFSPEGRLQEFTVDGDLVWEARLKTGLTVGRVTWTDTLEPG